MRVTFCLFCMVQELCTHSIICTAYSTKRCCGVMLRCKVGGSQEVLIGLFIIPDILISTAEKQEPTDV